MQKWRCRIYLAVPSSHATRPPTLVIACSKINQPPGYQDIAEYQKSIGQDQYTDLQVVAFN